MKKINQFLFLLMTFTLASSLYAGGESDSGGENGNGGDGIAISFYQYASSLSGYFATLKDPIDIRSRRYEEYLKILKVLVIETTDKELHDKNGKIKDALNFSEEPPRIVINRPRWLQLSKDEQRKLAFHEMLGLMKLELSDDYHLSSRLDEVAEVNRDKGVLNLEGEVPVLFIEGGLWIEEEIANISSKVFDETHQQYRIPLRKTCLDGICSYKGHLETGRAIPTDYLLTQFWISTENTESPVIQISASVETASNFTGLGSFDLNVTPASAASFVGISADNGEAIESKEYKNRFYIKLKLNHIRFGTENELESAFDQFIFALDDLTRHNQEMAVRQNVIIAAQKFSGIVRDLSKTLKEEQLANLDDFAYELSLRFNYLNGYGYGLDGSHEKNFFVPIDFKGAASRLEVDPGIISNPKSIGASGRDPSQPKTFSDNEIANRFIEQEPPSSMNEKLSSYDFFEKCVFDVGDHKSNETACN